MRKRNKGLASRDLKEYFEAIFRFSPNPILLVDDQRRILAFNCAAEALTGWRADEVVGRKSCDVICQCRDEKEGALLREDCPGLRVLKTQGVDPYRELYVTTKDGKEVVVAASHAYAPSPSGTPQVAMIFQEITKQRKREAAWKEKAGKDALTDLYNRHYFQEIYQRERCRIKRTGGSLSMVMLDLDRLKEINDQFGHPMGDKVLRAVGRMIKQVLRSTDIAARYGGDEFIIVLPDTDREQACVFAERLKERLKKLNDMMLFPFPVNVSIGLSHATKDYDHLIEEADSAMYQEKRSPAHQRASRKTPSWIEGNGHHGTGAKNN